MTLQISTRTFVGISQLLIQRQSDGVVFSWPQPETLTLSTGVEEQQQMGRDNLGRTVRANTYVKSEMPELNIQYQYVSAELISFQVGKQLVTGNFSTMVPRSLIVRQSEYAPAATGFLFSGVDETVATSSGILSQASGSYTSNLGISTKLVMQPDIATFDPDIENSFAIGDGGALKFSTNLVASNTLVTLLIPSSVAGSRISETLVGPLRVYATLIDTNNRVSLFEAPNVSANLSGRSINFGEGSLELAMYVNFLPGSCSSWSLIETNLKVAC